MPATGGAFARSTRVLSSSASGRATARTARASSSASGAEQVGPTLNSADGPELGQLARPTTLSPATLHENELVLSWTPVRRASLYEVQLRTTEGSWDDVDTCYTFHTSLTSGGRTSSTFGNPGEACDLPSAGTTVSWRVRAIDTGRTGGTVATSPWSADDLPGDPLAPSFTPTARSGSPIALAAFKGATLADIAPAVEDFPVLSWPRVSPSGGSDEYDYYRVEFALDEAFTNIRATYATDETTFVTPEDIVDNNVGQAYYYRVLPCTAASGCVSNPNAATGSFSKRAPAVDNLVAQNALTATAVSDAEPTDQVRFAWTPWNQEDQEDGSIRGYRIQVSTQPDFATLVDDAKVDQPWYVAPNKLYPNVAGDSDQLYVRVQAMSGAGQLLKWSSTLAFRKVAPKVTGPGAKSVTAASAAACPAVGLPSDPSSATYSRAPLLCWASAALTQSYEVEVYRGATKVTGASTKYAAWTPLANLAPGDYTWQVRRIDVSNQPSAWTDGGAFKIGLAAPTALAPAGTSGPRAALALTWNPVVGAVRYRVQIDQPADNFSSTIEDTTVPSTRYTPRGVLAAGTYAWRVTALDRDGNATATPSSAASSTFAVQTTPDPPKNGLLKWIVGSGQVYVSWDAPNNGGLPIDEYRLQYRKTGDPSWIVVAGIPAVDGSRNLVGLSTKTEYQVQLAAHNALGWGRWTGTGTIRTPDVPNVVDKPALTNLGGGRVKVDWNEPGNGGSTIVRYDVQVRKVGSSWPSTSRVVRAPSSTQAPNSELVVSGLGSYTRYEVRIRAANSAGAGLFGTSQSVLVPGRPSAPRWVSATSADSQVKLKWKSPAATNGSAVIRYKVQVYKKGAWRSSSTTSRTWTWSKGKVGTSYKFRVAAINLAGQGAWTPVKKVRFRR